MKMKNALPKNAGTIRGSTMLRKIRAWSAPSTYVRHPTFFADGGATGFADIAIRRRFAFVKLWPQSAKVEGKAAPLNNAEQGLALMQIIDAIYASATSGKPVAI